MILRLLTPWSAPQTGYRRLPYVLAVVRQTEGTTVTSIVIACAWPCLVVWLLIRALRQYLRYEVLAPLAPPAEADAPEVMAIIPARNEARNIAGCLTSLRAQTYPQRRLHITVVDDDSDDDTAERAHRAAAGDARVTVLRGLPLPLGWTGKSFACWQGAQVRDCEWLCFLDADTAAAPECLASAVRTASGRAIDMLSLQPSHDMVTVSERLVMLAGFLSVAVFRNLRRINRPDMPDADANGQFILIRHEVYQAVGGHTAVGHEICEDVALARLVKEAGYRYRLLGGNALIRARMYTGWRSLSEGFSKNATTLFGGLYGTVVAATSGILFGWAAFILPVGLWFKLSEPATHWWAVSAAALATIGSLILIGIHVAEARYFGVPWWYGLAFPVGYTMAAVIAMNGALMKARGRSSWKGRSYSIRSQG